MYFDRVVGRLRPWLVASLVIIAGTLLGPAAQAASVQPLEIVTK